MKQRKRTQKDIKEGAGQNLPLVPNVREFKGKRELAKAVNDKISELAWLLTDAKDYEEARNAYESLSSKTHLEERIVGLTRVLIEKSQFNDAVVLLAQGLAQFPNSYSLLNNYGLLHYRSGNNYDALRYFDMAMQCEKIDGEISALYNKGLALIELKYFDEAVRVFSELIKQDETDSRFYYELGYCELERKNHWEAIQLFRHAHTLGFCTEGLPAGLCCAYMGAGLLLEAWGAAEGGLRMYPDSEAMYENLAEVHLDLGHLEEAKEVLREGIMKFPESMPLTKLSARAEEEETPSFSTN